MKRILLVNPPIYDFSAYDFWLRPYGLLSVGGMLRGRSELSLFDYLDRRHTVAPGRGKLREDEWGRGQYHSEIVCKPPVFEDVPRRYRRYGLPRRVFRDFLDCHGPFDAALVQTGMTYWYPGVSEVLADIRQRSRRTVVALGGVYATLCPDHASSLGADLVVRGVDLEPLWSFLGLEPRTDQPPFWEGYESLDAGVLRLSSGCPFRCTYCSVPKVYGAHRPRPTRCAEAELRFLVDIGVRDIALYDDALLHRPENCITPFLEAALRMEASLRFHTPNGLNLRHIDERMAELMVRAGFQSFFLGYESLSPAWLEASGGKAFSDELPLAVERLCRAGADPAGITAYLMLGHPRAADQDLDASMKLAHGLGIRVMLSEFSPIPGTPDGDACSGLIDLAEPLSHNKTAFAIRLLGATEVNRLKNLCHGLNRSAGPDRVQPG